MENQTALCFLHFTNPSFVLYLARISARQNERPGTIYLKLKTMTISNLFSLLKSMSLTVA